MWLIKKKEYYTKDIVMGAPATFIIVKSTPKKFGNQMYGICGDSICVISVVIMCTFPLNDGYIKILLTAFPAFFHCA